MNHDTFIKALFESLEETFDAHHGIYLDKGTSLFETLDTITAADASRAAGSGCASLAAQVAHVTFYLEVIERDILTGDTGNVDWRAIWSAVREVTPEGWASLKQQLRDTSDRLRATLRNQETWNDDRAVGAALAVLAHTAYHLGGLRQALAAIRSVPTTSEPV
jgi:hypothetical protein